MLCTPRGQGSATLTLGNKLPCKTLMVKVVFNPREDLDADFLQDTPTRVADDTSTCKPLQDGLSWSWLQVQSQAAQGSWSWIGRKWSKFKSVSIPWAERHWHECKCFTCLSINLSSFRVYLKPLMERRAFSGNLELGINALSL